MNVDGLINEVRDPIVYSTDDGEGCLDLHPGRQLG